MPASRCGILAVALLLPVSLAPFGTTQQQRTNQNAASVSIYPNEVTVPVGKKQTFKAVIEGMPRSEIRWAVQEPDGGQITERGTYTAPPHVGLYHVVASSERRPAAKAVAKVTVVTEYDTPDWLRRQKR